mmetsp:Transcript_9200/g.37624  ORF Transcript_9200/g.37624 Transcript_9200/m.37624 type:complete len:254 (-) Transcript_9200:2675-3436(-)
MGGAHDLDPHEPPPAAHEQAQGSLRGAPPEAAPGAGSGGGDGRDARRGGAMARASGSERRGHRFDRRRRRGRGQAREGLGIDSVAVQWSQRLRGNEEGANRRGRFRLRPQPRDRLVRREHRHPRSHANARGGDDGHLRTKVHQAQDARVAEEGAKVQAAGFEGWTNVQRAARRRSPGYPGDVLPTRAGGEARGARTRRGDGVAGCDGGRPERRSGNEAAQDAVAAPRAVTVFTATIRCRDRVRDREVRRGETR